MKPASKGTVYVIDDDEAVRDSLQWLLEGNDYRVRCFDSAEAFLTRFDPREVACLIVDVRMPGMSGLELQDRLIQRGVNMPLAFITGHGDVPIAVATMKKGAIDFIEKPFDEVRLLASIRQGVELTRQTKTEAAELDELQARFDNLSTRQREVMELAVAGLSSKEIGIRLNISPKTVENHRAWVMERIGARNVADLIRKAMKIRSHKERLR